MGDFRTEEFFAGRGGTRREWLDRNGKSGRYLRALAYDHPRALAHDRVRVFRREALPSWRTGEAERIARAAQPREFAALLARLPIPSLPREGDTPSVPHA